jgi:hypothetical protein
MFPNLFKMLFKSNVFVNKSKTLKVILTEPGQSKKKSHSPPGPSTKSYQTQEPLNQRTYHADDFVQAPVVVVITH